MDSETPKSVRKSFFSNPSPSGSRWEKFMNMTVPAKKDGRCATDDSSPTSSSKKTHIKIQEIEKIVGFISEKFECEHNNFAGVLYAGPLALVWLGRIFFFEWTVVVKWEDVAQVQKRNDGIRIQTRTKANYDFIKVFNPEKTWSEIVSLHNDSVIDMPWREPTPRQASRSLRKMNSDPLRMSAVFHDDADDRHSGTSPREKRETMPRSVSEPFEDEECHQNPASSRLPSLSFEDTKLGKRRKLKEQWSSIIEIAYAETAIEGQELCCSLESFCELFVDDGAKFSIETFMEESGDKDIKCSEWTKGNDDLTSSRVIEYTHPVNAPMAPPMARARKEQVLRKFGNNGLVLETKTYVSDVPMTDCFYVADQIRVEPVEENKVSMTMSFDIEFVKSTMFKAIIARTTKVEFHSFMERLANYMSKSLGGAGTPIVPFVQVPESAAPMTSAYPKAITTLLVLVIILEIWIIFDMRDLKAKMFEIQSSQGGECQMKAPGMLGFR